MPPIYQTRTTDKNRPGRSANRHPVEIGDSSHATHDRPQLPFTRDKRVTTLLHKLQQDEEKRLEEFRLNTRLNTVHNHDREPIRHINLTSSVPKDSSSLAPRYDKPNEQTLAHSGEGLSDAEIMTLLRNIQNIDTSLVDIPRAGIDSLYSELNAILLNKQSTYNKQRRLRVAHHLSEIRSHAEMLLMSSPQRELLLSLLVTDTSSCPSPLSQTT